RPARRDRAGRLLRARAQVRAGAGRGRRRSGPGGPDGAPGRRLQPVAVRAARSLTSSATASPIAAQPARASHDHAYEPVWSATSPNTGGTANMPMNVMVVPAPTAVAACWTGTTSADSVM